MIRKVLHLLLITAIIVCPIVCRPGLCALVGGCSVPTDCVAECGHSCHDEGPHEHPAHHPLPPCDHDPRDQTPCDHNPCEGQCQCICGGAILPDAAELDFLLLLTPAPGSMATSGGVHDSLATQRPRPDQTAPDDDGVPSGRAIRCLHSSLLC